MAAVALEKSIWCVSSRGKKLSTISMRHASVGHLVAITLGMDEELVSVIAAEGAIDIRRHRHLRDRVSTKVQQGQLVRLLPGVYGPGRLFEHKVLGLGVWDPNAVLIGATAARATWWEELNVEDIEASSSRNSRLAVPGYKLRRMVMPEDLTMELANLRCAQPALSVLQMIPEHGATPIDEALRRRVVVIGDLFGTLKLLPHRDGNARAARLLLESRDEPWSYLEREGHALLRGAKIRGWKSNFPVRIRNRTVFIDVAWPGIKLAVEFDGWEFHKDYEHFVEDRRRDVELVRRGWTVLRFTASSMDTLVDAVRQVGRRLGLD